MGKHMVEGRWKTIRMVVQDILSVLETTKHVKLSDNAYTNS